MPKYSIKNQGFTLIELVMTMAIAGILIGIAIPSFKSTIKSSRLTSYANDLVGALNLARSEAVRRGIQVTVSNNGAPTHWESGWTVFVDFSSDEIYDPPDNLCTTSAIGAPTEDCMLRVYPALASGYTLTTGNSSYQKAAAYFPSGLSYVAVGDTFRLCNASDMTTSRSIVIDGVGRAHVSPPGSTVSCP
jgi:type IV fimbrial biogenesis protein FimT